MRNQARGSKVQRKKVTIDVSLGDDYAQFFVKPLDGKLVSLEVLGTGIDNPVSVDFIATNDPLALYSEFITLKSTTITANEKKSFAGVELAHDFVAYQITVGIATAGSIVLDITVK